MSLCKSAAYSAASILAALMLSLPAQAGVSEKEAARLGQDLTPIGAERAGNADGTIPEWTGGLQGIPSNVSYTEGQHLEDPFAADEVQFTITADNADQYADKLTPGQLAMLKKYGNYKMNVYPTRRSCAFPEVAYEATKKNAVNASLAAGGNGVENALLGFPFPMPKEGVEVVWNHNLRYRGFKLTRQFAALAPTENNEFTPIVVQDQVIFPYADPSKTSMDELDNISLMYLQTVIAPARRAGEVILVHDTINQVKGPRKAWSYNPGSRRVRRAPTIAYDNPQSYAEGMATSDNFDLFNGSPDRYEWDLKGKSEKYVAYNSYKLSSPDVSYDQIANTSGHINQDLVRYELHRVWEVDAKLREGHRHVYERRVNYFDEDSWTMSGAELYDSRGQLWRVQEGHMIQYYNLPGCWNASEVIYDLTAGRYVIQGLKNQEPMMNFNADELTEEQFTPAAIRRIATR